MKGFIEDIKKELAKYDLKVIGWGKYTLGFSTVYHVTAKGTLWESNKLKELWELRPPRVGGYRGMADAMHGDLYYLAPETTEVVVADPGDNIKGLTYLIFVFGGGG